MSVRVGKPHFVHIRTTTRPAAGRPPESEGQGADEHEPKSPTTPKGPVRHLRHHAVKPLLIKRAPASSGPADAPSDFVVNTEKDLGCGHATGYCSLVNEPSVAVHGSNVFETWNWSAAKSVNGGTSFAYINPYTQFPTANGGFCCDQLAYYEPTRGIYIWVLQYIKDGSGNVIRVAIANDANFQANNWYYYDLKASDDGSSGYWYDQPKIAASSNYLYLEASKYGVSSNSFGGSIISRMSLDTLATHGSLSQQLYAPSRFSPAPAQGATSTMYFGAHFNTSSLRLYVWPESVTSPTYVDVAHSNYPESMPAAPHSCPRIGAPAAADWCPRANYDSLGNITGYSHDDRINSGWVQNGVIGFSWDASQAATCAGCVLPAFPYPYVHVVRINETTKTLLPATQNPEPIIYSPAAAYQWSTIVPNANGDLGVMFEFGGGTQYETCGAAIHDSYVTPTSFWEAKTVASSTADTVLKKSGDYLTIRQSGPNWNGTCYTVGTGGDNGDVHPHYVSFGRRVSAPPPPPPPVTQYALTVTKSGNGGGTVTSSPAGIDCGGTCSANYNAGTSVTLNASNLPGAGFAGWSGAGCSGTGACTVTMNAAQSVNARFNQVVAPPTVLSAIVGPGRTIKVTKGGRKVSSVAHGAFKITVQDKTKKDNFHLSCRGLSKATTVKGKGTSTWNVTLAKGTCSYRSDAHKKLKGSFKVT